VGALPADESPSSAQKKEFINTDYRITVKQMVYDAATDDPRYGTENQNANFSWDVHPIFLL